MADPPSRYGVDAPELAHAGPFAVGVRTLRLSQSAQPDVLACDPSSGSAPLRDRVLDVELWYPARPKPGAAPVVYGASMPAEPPAAAAAFSVPGIAFRDAQPAGEGFALVVVSHGWSNDPVAMTWLTENLASKGYVVAAIRHDDASIVDMSNIVQWLLRRPLDIVYVTRTLQRTLSAERLIDATRTALIGYSAGGYGVLTAAGAGLDPDGPITRLIPGGQILPYVRGGAMQDMAELKGVRAVAAISPAGGGLLAAWSAGLRSLTAPLLLMSGDRDHRVDYWTGARAIFDDAVNARRYLLTFKCGGHSIGLNPAPDEMRGSLWDADWFDDPVWDKRRVNAISAHFITAFLDRHVKGEEGRAGYLDVPVAQSSDGAFADGIEPRAYDGYSPGAPAATLWKGFQRKHAEGLELLQAPAADPARQDDPTPGRTERRQPKT